MDPRGLRNNNPGNIEYGPFARSMGATGSDGRFAIFPDPESGLRAIVQLQKSYENKGLDTVGQRIGRWAPSSENNTSAYANSVAGAMGISPNTPFSFRDSDTTDDANFLRGMVRVENGRQPYGEDVINSVFGAPSGRGANAPPDPFADAIAYGDDAAPDQYAGALYDPMPSRDSGIPGAIFAGQGMNVSPGPDAPPQPIAARLGNPGVQAISGFPDVSPHDPSVMQYGMDSSFDAPPDDAPDVRVAPPSMNASAPSVRAMAANPMPASPQQKQHQHPVGDFLRRLAYHGQDDPASGGGDAANDPPGSKIEALFSHMFGDGKSGNAFIPQSQHPANFDPVAGGNKYPYTLGKNAAGRPMMQYTANGKTFTNFLDTIMGLGWR